MRKEQSLEKARRVRRDGEFWVVCGERAVRNGCVKESACLRVEAGACGFVHCGTYHGCNMQTARECESVLRSCGTKVGYLPQNGQGAGGTVPRWV